MGGPPKSMKSTIMMAVSVLVAGMKTDALDTFTKAVIEGRVVIFSAEASAGELRHMTTKGLKVKLKDNGLVLVADEPLEFQLDDERGLKKALFWLKKLKPKLVIFDPLAEFHTLEEKDSRLMIQLLRPFHEWAKKNDSAVVMVHHTRKKMGGDTSGNSAMDLRGSSAIAGKMDGILILTPKDGKGLVTISATFKRGASWQRDLQLKAYGIEKDAARGPKFTADHKAVYQALKLGAKNVATIAEVVEMTRGEVRSLLDDLVTRGRVALDRAGKPKLMRKAA